MAMPCELCGEPIAVERLRVLPQTTKCAQCVAAEELRRSGARRWFGAVPVVEERHGEIVVDGQPVRPLGPTSRLDAPPVALPEDERTRLIFERWGGVLSRLARDDDAPGWDANGSPVPAGEGG
jgi:hypothetical protein